MTAQLKSNYAVNKRCYKLSCKKKTTQEEKKNSEKHFDKKYILKHLHYYLTSIIHMIIRIEIVNDSNHKSPNTTTYTQTLI